MPVKLTPDWEHRRYEIAKDLLCAYATLGTCTKEDIQFAISTADDLIAELNRWKKNRLLQHTE